MTHVGQFARRVIFPIGLSLFTVFFSGSATPAWAGAIFEFREAGSSAVIGTLEIARPPATGASGWSTTDPSDLLALHLDDSLFHLGTGNLFSIAPPTGAAVFSFDGLDLDAGGFTLGFPTIPGDPAIDRTLFVLFGPGAGADLVRLATINTFLVGAPTFDDLFFVVNAVPEPATAALVVIGLAAGRLARRKRR